MLNEYIYLTRAEVLDRIKAHDTPALEIMIGTIISKAVTSGDHMRLNFLLDRIVGKPPENGDLMIPKPITLAYRLDDKEEPSK